ncbi:hypothetical protein PGH45_19410 [Legionella pneumophila]|nr:hypothetical protein [Legionella pneumophila]
MNTFVDDVEKIAHEFGYPNKYIAVSTSDEVLNVLDNTWDRATNALVLAKIPGFLVKETKSGEQEWSLGYDSLDKLDDAFLRPSHSRNP